MPRAPYGTDIYNQGQQSFTADGGPNPVTHVQGGVDVANLAGLVDVPLLDARGAAAMGQGYAQLGEGIAHVGGNLTKMLELQADAIKTKRITEAEREMAAISSEIAIGHANERDEMKWGEITAKGMEKLSELPEDLSQDARDHIESRRESWKLSMVQNTALESAKKSVRDADSDIQDMKKLARLNMDIEGANAATDAQVANGTLSVKGGELDKENNKLLIEDVVNHKKSEREKAAIENIAGLAMSDPEQAAEIVNRPDFAKIQHLDPTTVMRMRNVVESAQSDQFRAAHADAMDAIVGGKAMTDQDIRDIAGKRARPADVEKMISSLHEYQTNTKKAEMADPQVQKKLFGGLLDRVDKFNLKALGGQKGDKAREEYWSILNESKWLPTVFRGEINGPLYQKWSASGPKPGTTIADYVRQQITDEFTAGHFGVFNDPKKEDGSQIDYNAKAKANERRADVAGEMATYMSENPNAPREDVTKKLNEAITKPMTKADADEYLRNSANRPMPDVSVKPEDWQRHLGDDSLFPPPGGVAPPANAPPEPTDVLPNEEGTRGQDDSLVHEAPPQDLEDPPASVPDGYSIATKADIDGMKNRKGSPAISVIQPDGTDKRVKDLKPGDLIPIP